MEQGGEGANRQTAILAGSSGGAQNLERWASRHPKTIVTSLILAACALGAAVLFVMESMPLAAAGGLCALAVGLGLYRADMLLFGLLLWLPFLGLVRRLPVLAVDAASISPLLVVGPLATGVLLVVSIKAGVGRLTLLAGAVLAFSVLTLGSAFNPAQGGLKVGLAGLTFVLVPVLWFWIGRALATPQLLHRVLRMIAAVAVITALYGLWQTLIGFPSWDQTWIRTKGYNSLNVRGTIRPFSTFSNSTEYGSLLGIGLVVFWTLDKKVLRWPLRLGASVLLGVALFLIASRALLVFTVLALALTWLAKRGIGMLRAGALIAIAVVFLSLGLQRLNRMEFENPRVSSLIKHQLGGIGDPFNPKESTLRIHTQMVVSGVSKALERPFGYGAGAVSLASSKLGGKPMDTEVDFSNAGVALGVPGLILFSFIAAAGSFLAYRTAQKERSFLPLVAAGTLVVTALHWLTGGQYSTAPLPWLFLGWLDRQAAGRRPSKSAAEKEALTSTTEAASAGQQLPQSGDESEDLRDEAAWRSLQDPQGEEESSGESDDEELHPPERELQPLGSRSTASLVVSRLIDVTLSLAGLVLLGPLLAVLALVIRLSTRSSGLFKQVRLGEKGKPFRLVKLRTLSPETPPQVSKRHGQGTATRLGRWLRAIKLDEGPQLWNVIKGDMALVGPRPIIPEEYSERSHYQRLKVRPGLTGLWQLSNARGHPFDENPEYDLFYLANRSLRFDLWIIWRTSLFLLFGRETGLELAAGLWEKDPSWRQAVPEVARTVPGRSPTWRPIPTVLFVACVGIPLTLGVRADISTGMPMREIASSLAAALAKEGPRLVFWALGVYSVFAIAILVVPMLFSRRPFHLRRVVWATATVIGFMLVFAIPPVLAARQHLEQARESLLQATQVEGPIDLATIESSLDSARMLALTARQELESPITLGARYLPVVRGNMKAADALASAVSTIIPAVNQSIAAAHMMESPGPGKPAIFSKGRLDLRRVEQISMPLGGAAATARSAVAQVEEVDGLLLPPLRRALTQFADSGGRLANALDTGAKTSRLLPPLLGSQAPRTYFLMIQNGAEQRATGGYLGAFGILHADKGQLTLEPLQANSALPPGDVAAAPSPEFAERYDRFHSRSAWHNVNMTPHFPTASRMISELWQKRTGRPIDGVLAVDAIGLREMMRVSGPVKIPELAEQITPENMVRLVLNEAYVRFPDKSARVDFLLPIAAEVWGKLLSGEAPDPRALAQTFGRSFGAKHMQLWTRQEEKMLQQLGIDGGLKAPKGTDYLLVVAQNAAGNKVDFYAKRRINYRVNIARGGRTSARAEVVLENRAPPSGLPKYILGPFGSLPDPPGLNRSYVSLYVPRRAGSSDARLNGQPVAFESHSEEGFRVVSRYVEVLAGQASRLQVDLSSRLSRKGEYRLVLQRQPGLEPDSVSLSVKIPDGTVVKGMSPGLRLQKGRVTWQGPLTRDREFYVKFGPSVPDRFRTVVQKPFLILL